MPMKSVSLVAAGAAIFCPFIIAAQTIDLPTSKQLIGDAPGHPQRINGLPVSMAVSPDGRYVVTLNDGYGTYESQYEQSFSVLDTQTGAIADFPDARTSTTSSQTLYSGLAFSRDGNHIYASMASLTNPAGDGKDAVGSGVAVYSFAAGKIAPERLIHLPVAQLTAKHKTNLPDGSESDRGVPYPAAIAVVSESGREKLLVAENLTDDVVLLDAATGKVEKRFDLSESDAVPSTYPIALAVTKDGRRAFVALWNASEIVELDLVHGKVSGKLALLKPTSAVAAGTHPCDFEISRRMETRSTLRSPIAMRSRQ
jgi:DNA-binding beta-propeller fold protein YncE